jgi:hypothetical protein
MRTGWAFIRQLDAKHLKFRLTRDPGAIRSRLEGLFVTGKTFCAVRFGDQEPLR